MTDSGNNSTPTDGKAPTEHGFAGKMDTTDKIVVVGAHTILGEMLIHHLEKNESVSEFWVIDLHAPTKTSLKKMHFIRLDLIAPGADAKLAEQFEKIGATVLVHCASKNNPSLNWVYAHELEVIGTLNLTSAAKAVKLRKFVFCSSTVVYGASAKNPNYISESHPLASRPGAHFVKDKVDAEKQVAKLYEDAPQMIVTVLRFCLILGPRSENYFTELFRRSLVPTILGYDPLMQFIHERDALEALKIAVFEDHRGPFNIVGKGIIPLSYALRLSGKVQLPMLSFLAYPTVQLLWNLQAVAVPGRLLDFFKFLWVAEGEKAKNLMKFEARLSSKEAFLEFAKADRLERYSLAS